MEHEEYTSKDLSIIDAITAPLPIYMREPLILVIDAWEERLVWVVDLLTYANYRVYAPKPTFETFTWATEHLILPQAILFGQINPQDQFYTQRFLQHLTMQRGRQVPVVYFPAYLPDRAPVNELMFMPDAQGCLELLKLLWLVVSRSTR